MRLMKSLADSERVNLYAENKDFVIPGPEEHICTIKPLKTDAEHAEQVALRFKDGHAMTIELLSKPDEQQMIDITFGGESYGTDSVVEEMEQARTLMEVLERCVQ